MIPRIADCGLHQSQWRSPINYAGSFLSVFSRCDAIRSGSGMILAGALRTTIIISIEFPPHQSPAPNALLSQRQFGPRRMMVSIVFSMLPRSAQKHSSGAEARSKHFKVVFLGHGEFAESSSSEVDCDAQPAATTASVESRTAVSLVFTSSALRGQISLI